MLSNIRREWFKYRQPTLLVGAGLATVTAGVVVYRYVHSEGFRRKTNVVAAYALGIGSGVAAVYAVYLARRFALPNPSHALMGVLPTLRANPEVRSVVGSNLRPGHFKAYSYIGIRPRILQVMFQVCGEHSSAMVTLQTLSRSKGSPIEYKTLIVDFPNGERLLLKGTGENVVFQGYNPLS